MRAIIDSKYLWRLVLTALAFSGIALWFLYDGAITYPRQRERALAYQKLKEEERLGEWQEHANQRAWPTEDPGKPKTEIDIYFQLTIASMAGLGGLAYAFLALRARGKWIEVNESRLCTSWGRQFEFGQIVSLDKKKWQSKGSARVKYQEAGRKRRVVLDDWKYGTEPTRAILRAVEASLDASQIVGGPPEPVSEDGSK